MCSPSAMAIFVGGTNLLHLQPKFSVTGTDLRLLGRIGNCTFTCNSKNNIYLYYYEYFSRLWRCVDISAACSSPAAKNVLESLKMCRRKKLTLKSKYSARRTGGWVNVNFLAPPYEVAFLNPWNMSKYPILSLNSKIDFKALKWAYFLSFFD